MTNMLTIKVEQEALKKMGEHGLVALVNKSLANSWELATLKHLTIVVDAMGEIPLSFWQDLHFLLKLGVVVELKNLTGES